MNNTNQEFDAVAMMRQIRDQLSQQFQDWTLAEQQQYIRSHIRFPGSNAPGSDNRDHNSSNLTGRKDLSGLAPLPGASLPAYSSDSF